MALLPKVDANNGCYVQISYNLETDTVLYDEHVDAGKNQQTVYHDSSIVFVGNFSQKPTKQYLIECIERAIDDRILFEQMLMHQL